MRACRPVEAVNVEEQHAANKTFTDAMIRKEALRVASTIESYSDGSFKASPGWVENFKARMGISRGIYHGYGTERMKEMILNDLPNFNVWTTLQLDAVVYRLSPPVQIILTDPTYLRQRLNSRAI